MRVPTQALRDNVTVEDYRGSGAHGPIYAASRTLRASVQPTSKLVNGFRGGVVAASASIIFRPEAGPFVVGTRIVAQGVTYRAAEVYASPDARRPSYWEVLVEQYSVAVAP